jgi:phage regulator Rha-like protein
VKRNPDRFPDDFMFLVKPQEFAALRSQSVTLKRGQHAKYPPYAFTEQGVAMLSAVLRSPRAVQTSIAIVRAFVRLRGLLVSMDQLARKVEALERKSVNHDSAVQAIFQALKELMNPREKPAREIGFHVKEEKRKAEARRDK